MTIQIPVSVGEFLDKLTILQIKAERIGDAAKLANVRKELAVLHEAWRRSEFATAITEPEFSRLKSINEQLWDIEDRIREMEAAGTFDRQFVELARAVYITNDERAAIKKALNDKLGSTFMEEKSYTDYNHGR